MLVLGIAWCSYVVLFLIVYPFLRGYTGIVAFLPVLMTGWYAGAGPGVLAGLAAIPVTLVLTWFGSGSSLALSQETVIGATILNAMGGLVGYIRTLTARCEAESATRHATDMLLAERDQRLAWIDRGVRSVRTSESDENRVQRVLAGLSRSFPVFRTSYVTVLPDGRVTVVRSVGPEGAIGSNPDTDRAVCLATQAALRGRDLLVVPGVEPDELGASLCGAGWAALHAPMPEGDGRLGVLSFAIRGPHIWSGYERTTLRSEADLLDFGFANARVKASERRFWAIFEHSPFGMGFLDTEGCLSKVNSALCRILEYDGSELVGRTLEELRPPAGYETLPGVLTQVGKGQMGQARQRYLTKAGAEIMTSTSVLAFRDTDGASVSTLVMIEDITERLELEVQLRRVNRLESIGQFTGGVAHNFNNALTAISGYSELLARRLEANDPAIQELRQIQRVVERSAGLTRQLLNFSRNEGTRASVFLLSEAIENARDLFGPLIGEGVVILFNFLPGKWPIHANRSQIEQVIANLVINARDAMPDGGTITVEARSVVLDSTLAGGHPEARAGHYAKLSVTDTGIGMDTATMDRMFEPFFTTKPPGEGAGLGLALVQGAVKQGKGFVTVESQPGRGSTFVVFLPICEGAPTALRVPPGLHMSDSDVHADR